MRRILYYSLLCFLWVSVISCNDDEASQPPTPTFTVNRTTGISNSTEFVFTVDQVGSNTMAVLPYGIENPNDAGVIIPKSAFTNGKATVKFIYGRVGNFNAVVVANNHTGGGESVKNSYSAPQAIVISNSKTAISEFTFDKATGSKIDTTVTPHTITIQMPYGTDLTKISPKITAAEKATVTASSTDFTNPVTYTVKSQDGTKTDTYVVTVNVTPIEKISLFKSFQGIDAKKVKYTGRVFAADIDSAGNKVVLYDTINSSTDRLDSVAIDYGVKGAFAYARYAGKNNHVGAKDTVNLKNPLQITVVPQDSLNNAPGEGRQTYDIYFRSAPRLTAQITGDKNGAFNPVIDPATAKEFSLNFNVLNKTDVKTIKSIFTFEAPAGATMTGALKVNGVPFTNGMAVDYTKPVTVQAEVKYTADSFTFWPSYTVSVSVVK